jgi:hypothetical protein
MKVEEFIQKHSLTQIELPDWRPALLLMDDDRDDPRRFDDKYEVYTNGDQTIWVSINRTRNRFKVCYHEFLTACTQWENVLMNYELGPMVTR